MRSATDPTEPGPRGDLTARAMIRDAALRLFAEHGPDAVTVRQIAAAAQVSPALVLHHFGSKSGLRAAVDAHAAAAFDAVADDEDAAETIATGDGGSIAEAFARGFPPGSPLPAYLRRLVLSGDPAATALFRRWFDASAELLEAMERQGLASSSRDPAVRAAFLLANDVALLLLREPLREVLGFDPLGRDGMARWAEEVSVVYREGIWRDPDTPTDQGGH